MTVNDQAVIILNFAYQITNLNFVVKKRGVIYKIDIFPIIQYYRFRSVIFLINKFVYNFTCIRFLFKVIKHRTGS